MMSLNTYMYCGTNFVCVCVFCKFKRKEINLKCYLFRYVIFYMLKVFNDIHKTN